MIDKTPTKQELQLFWEQEPLAFHTSPMPGFEEQGLSAAQWALLTQPTRAFWAGKSSPTDPSLWSWAIANIPSPTALDLLSELGAPVAPETLAALLLRSASGVSAKCRLATLEFAAQHPQAWTAEKEKATAPELLTSPNNMAYLGLLDSYPQLLTWKKPSTGNGLLHSAVLYKAKAVVSALLQRGASQEPNSAGITPLQMAKEERMAWPSTFGEASSTPPIGTPPAVSRTRSPSSRAPNQLDLF